MRLTQNRVTTSICGVSRVLDELARQGVLDKTLVSFPTDNGYFHAEHWWADKCYPCEESIRVPLTVRDPRMARDRRGGTNDDFTLNVDFIPASEALIRKDTKYLLSLLAGLQARGAL